MCRENIKLKESPNNNNRKAIKFLVSLMQIGYLPLPIQVAWVEHQASDPLVLQECLDLEWDSHRCSDLLWESEGHLLLPRFLLKIQQHRYNRRRNNSNKLRKKKKNPQRPFRLNLFRKIKIQSMIQINQVLPQFQTKFLLKVQEV